jgi:mRNA interferase HigB
MRVISNKALVQFAASHSDADIPLQAWRKIMETSRFENFGQLKATFSTADKAGNYYVFNIGGNKFQLIAAIHFDAQKLYVRHVFTHKEYDTWKP